MKIQSISNNQTQYQSLNKSNNQPSFQHRKIYGEEHWDKDILHAITHNSEIKKLEEYLERKFAVLELTVRDHDVFVPHEKKRLSIECTYDRKKRIDGESAELFPPSPKATLLNLINDFKSSDFIEKIEGKSKSVSQKKGAVTASSAPPQNEKNKGLLTKVAEWFANL